MTHPPCFVRKPELVTASMQRLCTITQLVMAHMLGMYDYPTGGAYAGYVRLPNWWCICWVCQINWWAHMLGMSNQLVGAYAGYVKVSQFLDSNMSSSNFNIVLLCFALLCFALLCSALTGVET